MIRRPRSRVGAGDRGAFLVLTAAGMLGLVMVVAMVVDLGVLRMVRRSEQSAVDLAALAAGESLHAPSDSSSFGPQGACRAALESIGQNIGGFPSGATLPCNLLPTNAAAPTCTDGTPVQQLSSSGGGEYVLSIEYPVRSEAIIDPDFVSGAGEEDGTRACERMRVTLTRTVRPVFSALIGMDAVSVRASAVVRAVNAGDGNGAAALLLLERAGCGVLQTSGGGSFGSGIQVQSAGPGYPAVIHADSAGTVGPCTTNTNADGYVIYGTALPSASGGGPSIVAQATPDGIDGIIGMRSLATGGRGGAEVGTGISPAPVAVDVISRRPADNKYNLPTSRGGQEQISTLHARAYARTTMTRGAANSAGYRVLFGNSVCNGLDTTSAPILDQRIFVDCPSGFTASNAIFPAATEVVFTGRVSVPNNRLLSMPNVQRVYVRGCTSSCTGGNANAISVAGELRVNTGGDGTTTPACSDRSGPGSGGTTTNWTELATLSGPFDVTGQVRLCQTFVYLGENLPTYQRRAVTQTGTGPEWYAPATRCSTALPCPSDNGGPATIVISGGGGTADWSAPNQLSAAPTPATMAAHPFEDLALWTESSAAASIKGQGSNRTTGVFFAGNTTITFTGQAIQSQPLNAQFIARRLNVSSQGTLNLRPSPNDSVLTPLPGHSLLIR